MASNRHFEKFSKRTNHRMCGGKRKLKSSKASKMADRLKQRKYHCPICGGWHLTTKEKGYL